MHGGQQGYLRELPGRGGTFHDRAECKQWPTWCMYAGLQLSVGEHPVHRSQCPSGALASPKGYLQVLTLPHLPKAARILTSLDPERRPPGPGGKFERGTLAWSAQPFWSILPPSLPCSLPIPDSLSPSLSSLARHFVADSIVHLLVLKVLLHIISFIFSLHRDLTVHSGGE